jgi:hypothetical protein
LPSASCGPSRLVFGRVARMASDIWNEEEGRRSARF